MAGIISKDITTHLTGIVGKGAAWPDCNGGKSIDLLLIYESGHI